MNYRAVVRLISLTILIMGAFMIPALIISLIRHDQNALTGFGISMFICLLFSIPYFLMRNKRTVVRAREGYITVALSWILVSLIGALPLWLSGCVPSYMDCLFESTSGFTTTGASVLTDLDSLPKSIIYWRAFSHWLGGMGVLVFLLMLVPTSAGSGDNVFLMRAESPGPQVSKLVPKTKNSARILYMIYIGMTAFEAVLLLCGGLSPFSAITISMATAGTGGFSISNAGMAIYSPYIQWVVTAFMLLFGVNFGIYYLILQKSYRKIIQNEELRVYLLIALSSIAVITIFLLPDYHFSDAVRYSAFQVASIISTTGFATADFNVWPTICKAVLFILMFIGASAGSTSGGTKVSRVILAFKSIKLSMKKLLHPKTVSKVHMDNESVNENTIHFVFVFFGAYFFIAGISLFLVSLDHLSFEGAVSAVIACLNNVGPGFDTVGPNGSYMSLTVLSKLVLSLDMLIGRLEIFPVLMLLIPSNWKRMHV